MSAGRPDEATNLCDHCSVLSLSKLQPYLSRPGKAAQKSGYVLHQSSAELQVSAKTCALCALVETSLERAPQEPSDSEQPSRKLDLRLATGAILIEPKADTIGKTFPGSPRDGLYLSGLVVKAHRNLDGSSAPLRGRIRLYLDGEGGDDQTRADVIGRPNLSSPRGEAAFSMIKNWISGCKTQHAACCRSLSGVVLENEHLPSLPPRVLELRNGVIRLVATRGMPGRYAALSHCWGSQDFKPLSTTKQSLAQFLVEIPSSRLPDSFRDAITVTREIGLHWLWIDSLCIVQDDEGDWETQSELMGSVYENAEVTIAASHSSNSWQGFLAPRLPRPASVHLANFLPADKPTNTKVMATLRYESVQDTFPEHGVLNERAWATQEWLLSRRMVFFTRESIVWSCKEITQRETGERCYNISRNLTWTVVAERYSDRKLTFPSDKVMALEGFRRELGKKTGHSYALGLWKELLPNQLLWQVTEHSTPSNVLELPSWTWMSVPCGVRFLLVHKAKSLVSSVVISDPPKELSLRAWCKNAVAVAEMPPSENDELKAAVMEDLALSNVKGNSRLSHFICGKDGEMLGWVVLDAGNHDRTQEDLTFAALMGGLHRRDEDKERRTGRVISKRLRHYWVLAMKGHDDGSFERIGVGKTYGREWWQDATQKTVRIK